MTMYGRMVIAGEFWHGATGAGLAQGFRKVGWDVDEVDLKSSFISSPKFLMRVASRLLGSLSEKDHNDRILSAVREFRPKVFLAIKGTYITPETLHEVKNLGAETVIYYPDYHFNFSKLDQKTFQLYNLFVTSKSFQIDSLRESFGVEAKFVHHGYSTLAHFARGDSDVKDGSFGDVTYIGNHSSYKQRWMEAVVDAFPSRNIQIVGHRWKEIVGRDNPIARCVLGHQLFGNLYSRAVQGSRVNIAVQFGPDETTGWEDFVSTRTFEIPASRGFMLHQDNEEVRSLYEPGTEIGVFSSPEELCEQIEYYIDRPELRQSMLQNAYRRCVPAYSYDARAAEISDLLSARAESNRL